MDVNILKLTDAEFPPILTKIPHPPKQLYWTGQPPVSWLDQPKAAIVGSRKISAYGRTVTHKLASELARAGVVIISGLAYGVDIAAHQAALAAGGITAAVLPSSLEDIYPPSHATIAKQIAQRGTLLTEYSGGAISFRSNFVARNRLVSGLADVLIITEAALKSGSLHTARFALEQGKTVMAVPGNITSLTSEGANNLIKSGAIPITDVSDVLFALKISPKKARAARVIDGTDQERTIYKLIAEGVADQEELALAARIDSPALSSTLTMLEISGHIRPAGGGSWVVA